MDSMEKVTGSILAEAKEAVEGALLIGLISHYTGYTPDNTEETVQYMANLDQSINSVCEDIVLKLDTDEIRELIKFKDEEIGVFKQELFNFMKEMEKMKMDNKLDAFIEELKLIVEIKKSQTSNYMGCYQEGDEMWEWLHGKVVAFNEILETIDNLYEKHK